MKIDKRFAAAAALVLVLLLVTGCTGIKSSEDQNEQTSTSSTQTSGGSMHSKSLVVYFSRTGEQYEVGKIDRGNTAIIADMIASKTNSDKFEIVPVEDYPYDLNGLFERAKKEQEENARPDYKNDVDDWDSYDTIYLGYPLWYNDLPMIVYHFIEDHDFSGKTICPFDTSGSEGLAGTVETIRQKCPDAEVTDGLNVRGSTAQNDRDAAEKAVEDWLKELNKI